MDMEIITNEMNPLMLAAERGDSNVVNFCLKSGFNVNEIVNEMKAVDLAWNNQHFEIVFDLLKANSQFPVNFEVSLATKEIKELVDITDQLHELILNNNLSEISKILKNNPGLHHFYSTENISAPAFALKNKKLKVYEFFVANNVYIGPDENVDEIFKTISQSKCKDLKKIHLKYLKNFKDNHLIILALNSVVDQDDPSSNEKLSHVRKAFKFLDEVDPFISLILQIVAASRDFKIIFDFEYSAIQVSALKIHRSQELVREIKIPALDLLNPMKILDVYGSIARELCIYAFEIVYKNHLKPKLDHNSQIYNIINSCESNRQSEELVDKALNSSTVNNELIALVPQMMIKYSNNSVKMDECRENFSELFKFCQDVIEPEMKRKLPSIKSSAEQKAQKFKIFNQRQRKVLVALILAIPFTIWLTLLLNKPYIEPLYSCGNLTDEQRSKIFESTVDFQGVNVIFGDLFGRNSSACELLSPQEVTRMLKVFGSGKFVENYTGIYENFTAEENKALNQRPVRFGMEFASLSKMKQLNTEQMRIEKLNENKDENIFVKYMKTKFLEPSLQIEKKVHLRTKFYVERWTLYQKRALKDSDYLIDIKRFTELSEAKLLLLSDKGGSGKSTYFRHMAWKLKRRFPLKWISYVDLKQHIHVLQDVPKTDANLTTLVDYLSSKILNLTSKVEIEVFGAKFLSNDSIFLWDGVDEVSPMYTNETLRLVEIVKRLTDNKQWISTRPHLEKQVRIKLGIKPHVLEEFVENDKEEFIAKYLEANKIKVQNISAIISKIDEFLNKLYIRMVTDVIYPRNATNPQMLYIVCKAYEKNQELNDKTNLYTIYDGYVTSCFNDVFLTKGEVVRKDFFRVTELGLFRKYHQHYAISREVFLPFLSIFTGILIEMYRKSEISKPLQKLQDEEVMRFGIIYKFNSVMIFEHQIFRDFFVAQYFYTDIWENPLSANPRDEEADYRLNFLFYVLRHCSSRFKIVCDFINGFVEAYSDTQTNSSFSPVIKRLMLTNYSDLMYFVGDQIYIIETTTKFFKKDHDVISAFWKINQNRTYFHEYFETIAHVEETEQMTKIVNENFNIEDRMKIVEGKHQAANFLRVAWQKRQKNDRIAFTKAINFKCNIEKLGKIQTFEKFMEYLETQNYSREELLEFFKVVKDPKAIKTDNQRIVLIRYAKKLLSAQDFTDMTEFWGPGWKSYDV